MENKMKISILPNQYLDKNNKFNKDEALKICGKIAGVCYDKEGFEHLNSEPEEKTNLRINMTLDNGHHSVYEHIYFSLNIKNIPKILAMFLNNEKAYTTSEKSARYTEIVRTKDSNISEIEEELYKKWLEIFETKINEKYEDTLTKSKIKKLAQENARYLVTVFMPTEMIYSTSLRQINYIVSWMKLYIKNSDKNNRFESKLSESMKEFIEELKKLNLFDERLQTNEKNRELSLIKSNLENEEEYFGNVYNINYLATYACLAQAQRHRTLDYKMQILEEKKYFVPPIIEKDENLKNEWLEDMEKVKDVTPQGELVKINECGKYEDFILKCKERLCTCAQLEIMMQTRETLIKYKEALDKKNHPLREDIVKYAHGARCTFQDYSCPTDCKFKEGKTLTRTI